MRRQFVTPFLLLCSTFLLSTTLAQHPGIAPTSVNGALPPQATARLDCALNPNSCVDLCYQTNCTNTLGPPPYNVIFSEANNNTATYFEYLKASGSIVNTSEDTEDPCGQWSPWGEGQETVMEGNALLTQITLTFARLLPNSLIHRCASPNDVNNVISAEAGWWSDPELTMNTNFSIVLDYPEFTYEVLGQDTRHWCSNTRAEINCQDDGKQFQWNPSGSYGAVNSSVLIHVPVAIGAFVIPTLGELVSDTPNNASANATATTSLGGTPTEAAGPPAKTITVDCTTIQNGCDSVCWVEKCQNGGDQNLNTYTKPETMGEVGVASLTSGAWNGACVLADADPEDTEAMALLDPGPNLFAFPLNIMPQAQLNTVVSSCLFTNDTNSFVSQINTGFNERQNEIANGEPYRLELHNATSVNCGPKRTCQNDGTPIYYIPTQVNPPFGDVSFNKDDSYSQNAASPQGSGVATVKDKRRFNPRPGPIFTS